MRTRNRCRSGRGAGFTLIEVLLVVAILGILATVVVVNLSGRQMKAQIAATRQSISAICLAVDTYEVDVGKFPSSLQNLIQSSGEPNWSGPYIKGGGIPGDGWGSPFNYSVKGDNDYVISSPGPDKQSGTGDDITSFTN